MIIITILTLSGKLLKKLRHAVAKDQILLKFSWRSGTVLLKWMKWHLPTTRLIHGTQQRPNYSKTLQVLLWWKEKKSKICILTHKPLLHSPAHHKESNHIFSKNSQW